MKKLLALALFLLGATCVCANYNGYVSPGGYAYRDGYWYYGSQAYTRAYLQYPGYWYCGIYYPGSYYYQYTPYYPPATYQAPAATFNFKQELLKIAKDKSEFAEFMEGLRALGLDKLPSPPLGFYQGTYGGPYSLQGHYYSGAYPVQANTQYGYSYNTLLQSYGDSNLNQLFQQAAQLVAGQQKLTGDGFAQFQGLVGKEGESRARVAEIVAKTEFVRQAMLALQSSGTTKIEGLDFKVDPAAPAVPKMDKVNGGDVSSSLQARLQQAWGDHAAQTCGSCHTGKNVKGGFELNSYLSMSREEKARRVWPRVFSTDEKRRMPRSADGSAGPMLTDAQKQLWILN